MTETDTHGSVINSPAPDLKVIVPLCFQLGWTMAILYTDGPAFSGGSDQLCSTHELDRANRTNLEMTRLVALVKRLKNAYPDIFKPDLATAKTAWWQAGSPGPTPAAQDCEARRQALHGELPKLNLTLLTELAKCGTEAELGYQVGRSLRDTVLPPALDSYTSSPEAERLARRLRRDRVEILQEWLTTLAAQFPQHAATIVSTSLGRWSDLAQVALRDDGPGRLKHAKVTDAKDQAAQAMAPRLLQQGDIWFGLLVGTETTDALRTPEAIAAAGDATVRRSLRIIWNVTRHYWWAIAFILVLAGAIITFAIFLLGDAGKVFTSIATVAAALGISWKGIASAIPRVAGEAGRPIFETEEVEAMAWSVTILPPLAVNRKGTRYLRSAGITPEVPLGRM